jgi:hypothetical protein
VDVPVIAMSHLLVTKLTRRGDKSKDLLDVYELLQAARVEGVAPDLTTVRTLVAHRPDALALLDEIERARHDEDTEP